ncbi:hypothetical protein [Pedobacter sp. N23S346]|uniref:hypothetical protein n=1 Tax=Pedobacter sp. N23S346 TaxID=3402750 RepID=UPI003AC6AE8F
MTEIILKGDVEQSKIDALLSFLKSSNIDAEVKITNLNDVKKSSEFSLSAGIWRDYDIKAEELRNKAWKR